MRSLMMVGLMTRSLMTAEMVLDDVEIKGADVLSNIDRISKMVEEW